MTQSQAQQYVVIQGREIQHGGIKYPADTVVDLPEDVALIHIEGGTLRPYVDKIDSKKKAQ
jgi:hypothetical protein